MRLGSAGLMAMLWALSSSIATASPLAEERKPPAAMPIMRRQSGTAPTPTSTPEATTTPATTPTSTPPAEEATTTVTVTTTVAGNAGGAVTVGTTVLRTITTTIVVTTTVFETTTVTSDDVATATLTIYATSTVLAKRSLNFLPAEAAPVDAPAALVTPAADPRKRAFVEKRALVTVVVTVTGNAGAGAGSTVFSTKTNTVIQTTTSNLVHTSTITSVQYNNAQTTVTVTSTLIVTSTAIETSAPTTVENGPTTGNFGTATLTGDGGSSTGGSSSGSGELSTGAKAGIGAAVGVVGLAALIGLGWWFYKRRKANRPSAADLADMRAYDPNGPSLNNGMTEADYGRGAAATAVPTHRREPPPRRKSGQLSPPTGSVSPMSNNNVSPAGEYGHPYGRPAANELHDTRVMPPEMGGDEVVEMGDGQPRPPFQSGPASDVYEMPDQRYR